MDVNVCPRCKRLFQNTFNQEYCPVCAKEVDDEFKHVREFVRDNPGHTARQVAEIVGVPVKQINRWVREERLEFSTAEGSGLLCEKCRKPIATGRFCEKCKAEMHNTLQSAVPHDYKVTVVNKIDRDGEKMRFLNQ